jgi:protein-S-isoprenylcysteine O-methyltransferase Ste14
MSDPAATPWFFRHREMVFGFAYGAGFFFGFLIAGFAGQLEPTYARLGDAVPWLGLRGGHATAVLLVIFGFAWRVWGAAYLSSSVVWWDFVETGALHVAGPYRFTRNPLYFGNVAIALGIGMLGPPAVTGLVLVLNLILIIALIAAEEQSLARRFGAAYAAYAARVPRLIPVFFRAAPPDPMARPSLAQGLRSEVMTGGFVCAMLVGFVTQQPLSWPVAAIYVASIVAATLFDRPARAE